MFINLKNIKNFSIFISIYFLLNLLTSITLSFAIFSIFQGLIFLLSIFIISFFLILKNNTLKYEKIFFCLIIFLSLFFWSFFFDPALNANDDFTAYLHFYEKTALEGTLSVDPLSSRRMYTLGGLFPFQGSLSSFKLSYLSLIEPTLGILLTSVAIISFNKHFLTKTLCIILLMLSPLLGSKVLANTIGVYILVFFSYTILNFYSLFLKKNSRFKELSLILIIISTSLSLAIKPIPFIFNSIIIFFLIINVIMLKKINFKFFYYILIGLFLSVLYLYPFLKASYESSGTLIYPILGDGWRNSDGPQVFNLYLNILNFKSFAYYIIQPFKDFFFVCTITMMILLIKNRDFFLKFSIFISYIIFYLTIVFTVGDDLTLMKRYSFPISFSIILFLLNFSLKNIYFFSNKRFISYMMFIVLFFILIFAWFLKGEQVNTNRNKVINFFNKVDFTRDLEKINFLKEDDSKILTTGQLSIFLLKNNFENLIIFDVPFQMLPWRKKLNMITEDDDLSEKSLSENFYRYLENNKIKYIIVDNIVDNIINQSNSLFNNFLIDRTDAIIFKTFTLYKIK